MLFLRHPIGLLGYPNSANPRYAKLWQEAAGSAAHRLLSPLELSVAQGPLPSEGSRGGDRGCSLSSTPARICRSLPRVAQGPMCSTPSEQNQNRFKWVTGPSVSVEDVEWPINDDVCYASDQFLFCQTVSLLLQLE